MLATQKRIDSLADRIERAYRLRNPEWRGGRSSIGVWRQAAESLNELHESDPSIPLDPELYVLAQPMDYPYANPWCELTQPESRRRYRGRVRAIVGRLRRELAAEVRVAEERINAGLSIERVVMARSRRFSPLGCYIVARRAGRPSLARRFLAAVVDQHRSCPLYRQASSVLLPPGAYPVVEIETPEPLRTTLSKFVSATQSNTLRN